MSATPGRAERVERARAGEPIEGGRFSVPVKAGADPASLHDGPRSIADLVVTVALLVPLALCTVVGLLLGVLVLGASSCYSSCNPGLVAVGALFGAVVPIVVGVLGFVVAVRRLRARRIAFWVPLVALAGIVLVGLLGQGIAAAGVG